MTGLPLLQMVRLEWHGQDEQVPYVLFKHGHLLLVAYRLHLRPWTPRCRCLGVPRRALPAPETPPAPSRTTRTKEGLPRTDGPPAPEINDIEQDWGPFVLVIQIVVFILDLSSRRDLSTIVNA